MGQYLSRVSVWQHSAPSSASSRTGAELLRADRAAPSPAWTVAGSASPDDAGEPASFVRRGGYRHKTVSGKALLATLALHVLGAALLLSMGMSGAREAAPKRLTVFDVRTPTPPPPAPPPPREVKHTIAPETPPAQITAPKAMMTLVSQQPAAPPRIDPRPAPAVEVAAPAAPSQPAAAPATITPPDFSAAQLNNPGPEYPFQSRRDREQGVALLKVLVTPEGRAGEVKIERSSGYSRLDRVALKTVRRWRFVPAKQAGVAVAAWVLVPVGFSLS